ncbi:MAG: TonB-dependent receptor plug domain-containing protein, partial [Sinobacteraceae bacterium]|nr:TonB-dependent receptor plug domain-containing protein [Nevskiaceae bacterium]
MNKAGVIAVGALLAGNLARPAGAQVTLMAGGAEVGSGLEQIVVTARKRVEAPIDVPISITAFSEETLSELNIRSFDDYATKTPNLSFSYGTAELGFGATRSVAIRGIAGENTVGVYIDDTPVPDSIDPRVVDIERIEVLKGPQGTLFGQGSLGGNLRIITVQPTPHETNGHFEARAGHTSGAGDVDYGVSFAGGHDLIADTVS